MYFIFRFYHSTLSLLKIKFFLSFYNDILSLCSGHTFVMLARTELVFTSFYYFLVFLVKFAFHAFFYFFYCKFVLPALIKPSFFFFNFSSSFNIEVFNLIIFFFAIKYINNILY